jgi:hypothetical protein
MIRHIESSFMRAALGVRHVCSVLALGAVLGCQGGSSSGDADPTYVGGWSNEVSHLFVCFDGDRHMWLGDSPTEIGGTSYCSVDAAGGSFHCTDPDGGDPFDGELEASGDQLTLQIVPCPSSVPSECQLVYARAPGVTCE